jgi:ketose-bisphosphate aldolase
LEDIMRAAYAHRVVVPAFNVAHLPMVEPIAGTLVRFECFGLVEVARPDVEKLGAESFEAVADAFRQHADRRYVRLHQDHVPVIDEDGNSVDWAGLIREGLRAGYDSVMVDGSRLPLDENIRVTRAVADLAHAQGACAEAELGAVLGHEQGPLPPYEELFRSAKGFTDVEEARRFVRETGVDWLSVAIGNMHGSLSEATRNQKKVEARLNVEHLKALSQATGVPLVLHGGSGIRQESVRAAMQHGITKINIGTTIRQAYEQALNETGRVQAAQQAVAQEVECLIVDRFGVQGSARELDYYTGHKELKAADASRRSTA